MQMTIDKAGRCDAMAAVAGALADMGLADLGGFADGDDFAVIHRYRRLTDDAAPGINRDQPIDVGDNELNSLQFQISPPPCAFYAESTSCPLRHRSDRRRFSAR